MHFDPSFVTVNPLSPYNDQQQFSLNDVHTWSRDKVTRITKMIIKEKMPWSFIKFSQLILKKMYGDQFGEFTCGYSGLKGLTAIYWFIKWSVVQSFYCCQFCLSSSISHLYGASNSSLQFKEFPWTVFKQHQVNEWQYKLSFWIPSYLSGDGIYTLIFLHPFAWLCFILSKLFSNVRTDVAPAFLRREQLEFETVLSTSRSGTYMYKIHQQMKTFQTWANKGRKKLHDYSQQQNW